MIHFATAVRPFVPSLGLLMPPGLALRRGGHHGHHPTRDMEVGMRFHRCIAALVLLTVPGNAFAQVLADHRQLERVRERLSHASVVWEPSPHALALSLQVGSCADARLQGRRDAEAHHGGKWWYLSVVAGFFVPGISVAATTGAAALTHPQPKTIKAGLDESCYRDGYGDRARKRNVLTALWMSLLGTTAIVGMLAASGGFYLAP